MMATYQTHGTPCAFGTISFFGKNTVKDYPMAEGVVGVEKKGFDVRFIFALQSW